ncbi:hypothetical protein SU69_07545 [Thermosipho melanesiensis]|uniref:Uncharacterized protein n=2 Tax=Thermosipho melanesiensis TaxID=46541 RepID=A6LN30_THEM4|nr:hypothetical protein [Thermosipho melanesiensis]ABR31331.1 hypothetical protein Tmel_1484 [Thermosipho melanesiensis BI429]APT74925.1 hypothetical protein BW47_07900 [Thermosipho melanesiensis]OOC36354.1 hypothetical protein SU68_07615 [Thermosipho melanesiensis]OOC37172.1 hypothetical protein SU69_07545 [Thermosipho melanesiensis]OOC37924.1 hypothetical protein SU70_07555 [Thermosipho melanesiensis]
MFLNERMGNTIINENNLIPRVDADTIKKFVKNPISKANSAFKYDIITNNNPFILMDMVEETIMNNIINNPLKAKQLQSISKEKAIEYIKDKIRNLGYKEMYVSFEETIGKLYVYLYLKNGSVENYKELIDEYKSLMKLEREVAERYPLINCEILSLSDEEFIGKNMIHFEF